MNQLPMLYHKGKGGSLFQRQFGPMAPTSLPSTDKLAANCKCPRRSWPKARMWAAQMKRRHDNRPRLRLPHFMLTNCHANIPLTPEEAQEERSLPTLAHDFSKHRGKVRDPAYVQPKLDGFRCLVVIENGKVTLLSRAGIALDLPHIKEELEQVFVPPNANSRRRSLLPRGNVADHRIVG